MTGIVREVTIGDCRLIQGSQGMGGNMPFL